MKIERVMERVYDRGRLHRAWLSVRSNAGAAGIDHVTVEAFAERAEEHLDRLHEKLQAGTYRFKPVRRAEIPKPGSPKKRPLGIPIVRSYCTSYRGVWGFGKGQPIHPFHYTSAGSSGQAGSPRWRLGLRRVAILSGVSRIHRGPWGRSWRPSN